MSKPKERWRIGYIAAENCYHVWILGKLQCDRAGKPIQYGLPIPEKALHAWADRVEKELSDGVAPARAAKDPKSA